MVHVGFEWIAAFCRTLYVWGIRKRAWRIQPRIGLMSQMGAVSWTASTVIHYVTCNMASKTFKCGQTIQNAHTGSRNSDLCPLQWGVSRSIIVSDHSAMNISSVLVLNRLHSLISRHFQRWRNLRGLPRVSRYRDVRRKHSLGARRRFQNNVRDWHNLFSIRRTTLCSGVWSMVLSHHENEPDKFFGNHKSGFLWTQWWVGDNIDQGHKGRVLLRMLPKGTLFKCGLPAAHAQALYLLCDERYITQHGDFHIIAINILLSTRTESTDWGRRAAVFSDIPP